MMVSGERVVNRITSLTDGSVSTVYYKNRGKFVEQSLLKDLPKYPLGAGLGRYGQMYSYFGNKKRHDARPLYAEIQLSAWLYDGGLLLVALGYGIMIYACYMSLRIALFKHMNRMVSDGAALVAGLNVGWLAISFSYPLFVSQTGITFCLLNGVLYAAFTSICSNSNRARTQQTVPAQSAK